MWQFVRNCLKCRSRQILSIWSPRVNLRRLEEFRVERIEDRLVLDSKAELPRRFEHFAEQQTDHHK